MEEGEWPGIESLVDGNAWLAGGWLCWGFLGFKDGYGRGEGGGVGWRGV